MKTLSLAALAFCGLWGASSATATPSYSPCGTVAGNIVTNCGFETGDFTSWTLSGNTDPTNSGNYYYVDAFDAYSGNYGAALSQYFMNGTAPLNLSQNLTTVTGLTYAVSFYLEQDSAPQKGYVHSFTATLGGTSLLNLTPSVATPGTVGSFVQYTATFTASSTTSLLNFAIENDDLYWSLDDVVVASAVPEPGSLMMLGSGLVGLAYAVRKKLS